MSENRPWKLVAPWYRWQRQFETEQRAPRQTRPVLQKFDQPDFVKSFTKDPQRSLRFRDDLDTVFKTVLTDAPKQNAGPLAGKFSRLYVPDLADGLSAVAKNASLVPTGVRKVYLATHKRYYLVVCELHCDEPGFPTTTPDQVCQAGFVVRRRSFNFPKGARKEALKTLQQINGIQQEIAYWEQTGPAKGLTAKRRAQAVRKAMAAGTYEAKRLELRTQLEAARQALFQWKDASGVVPILEGWTPGPFENIGSWQIVEEKPQQTVESIFPLYALFPDPNILDHGARGKNIYFGALPTSSLDTDERGGARFDDQSLYEMRCFVRRHKLECPRQDQAPDCPGEIFWSEPTEVYKLASHGDLIGTSQHPITIQVPDLGELAAQVASLPISKFAPVKIVQPQSFNFDVDDGKAKNGRVGGGQVCFFAIPLITLVALFVLKLFLPILVFLFGLFFLLQLKFCIPPSLAIDAGLKAELEAIPPGINVDVELGVSLITQLNKDLQAGIAVDSGIKASGDIAKLDFFSNLALLPIGNSIKAANSLTAADAGPDLTVSLEFEPRVEVNSA